MDRLVNAQGAYGSQGFDYDPVGNRLGSSKDSVARRYAYAPDSNRLTAVDGTADTHDPNGNTVSDDTDTLAYNQANRLAEAAMDGEVLGRYRYNALGQRVTKMVGTEPPDYAAIAQRYLEQAAEHQNQAAASLEQAAANEAPAASLQRQAQELRAQAVEDRAGAAAWLEGAAANEAEAHDELAQAARHEARAEHFRSRMQPNPQGFWWRKAHVPSNRSSVSQEVDGSTNKDGGGKNVENAL